MMMMIVVGIALCRCFRGNIAVTFDVYVNVQGFISLLTTFYLPPSYVIDPSNNNGGSEEDMECPAKPHLKSRSSSEENIVFDIGKEVLRNG